MHYKYQVEKSLQIIERAFDLMIKTGVHNNLIFAGDSDPFKFSKFKKELEESVLRAVDLSRLRIVYSQCYNECRKCLEIYFARIKDLPTLKNMDDKNSVASILDIAVYPNDIYAFQAGESITFSSDVKCSNFVFDHDIIFTADRTDLFEYCMDIKELLGNSLFDKPSITSSDNSVLSLLPGEVAPFRLSTSGDYKLLCQLFGGLTHDNSKRCHFLNTPLEISKFIFRCFNFDKDQNPTVEAILKEVYFGQAVIETIGKDETKLRWKGNHNQLYYCFKILHKNPDLCFFTIDDSLEDIANIIFENIVFDKTPAKSAESIFNVLKKNKKEEAKRVLPHSRRPSIPSSLLR